MKNNNIENDRLERMKKTVQANLLAETEKSLKEITESFPDDPQEMEYFYERFKEFTAGTAFNENGKTYIASTCIQTPIELILAVGATPIRICSGAYATDQVGAEFLPAKSCPLVKSTWGAQFLNLFPMGIKPAMVINPTTCDQKKKMGEIETNDDIPIYSLEVPPTKDSEEARMYWQRVVKKLARELEKVTGQKLKRRKLEKAIKTVSSAQAQYRRFHNIRKKMPVIRGKDAILVSNAFFIDDITQWTNHLAKLNDELEEKLKQQQYIAKEKTPRLLLTGSPSIFPNMKLPVMVEELGGIVVADEFCSSSRLLYDTVAVDEWYMYDMIPALADRYLKPCTCPNFTPNTDRERKLLNSVKEFAADGVIYQAFAGCQLYEMESRRIGKMLEENGIPMLYIETDYSPDDKGQLTTRIEAFLEALQTKKQ